MPRQIRVAIVLLLGILLLPAAGRTQAALVVSGYSPEKHDRFENSSSFIGNPYNWSGVGRTNTGQWGTLVSPSFAISATHLAPGIGSLIRFYASNDPSIFIERQVVATVPTTQAGLANSSDLVLSQLSAPVSNDISAYPILSLPAKSDYIGQEIFVWGLDDGGDQASQRLGRNQITGLLDEFSAPALGASQGDVFIYDYDPAGGLGDDEARVEGGDSGAPSFVIAGGVPALVGIHWFRYEGADGLPGGPEGSGDTFVPSFIDELNAAISSLGSSETVFTVTAVPEPSSLWLVALAGVRICTRRRRCISDAVRR